MDISITVLGPAMVVFILLVGYVSYLLGRKKTQNPVLTGVVGALLALVPPLGLIYLAVLALKKETSSSSS